jgi:hypothetical protein
LNSNSNNPKALICGWIEVIAEPNGIKDLNPNEEGMLISRHMYLNLKNIYIYVKCIQFSIPDQNQVG